MNKITEKMNEIIDREKITKTSNIVYGANIPKVKSIIPTPWKSYIKFEETVIYFYYFDELGITLYPFKNDDKIFIPWEKIEKFKVKRTIMYRKMIIEINKVKYKFQITNKLIGCPWLGENIKFLESYNYFYKG